jgi:hypothetical protein
MRFDDPAYLAAWRERREWPAIHNAMSDFAAAHMRGNFLLDLGCAYGLLGARLASENGGLPCAGIEANETTIRAAQDAGVPIRFYKLKITRDTLPALSAILDETRARTVVARRILPELWGEDLEGGRLFADALAKAGVRELLIEGRVVSERSTNALRSIDAEVDLLSLRFREANRSGALSYLVLR